jgi:hypothetical protein
VSWQASAYESRRRRRQPGYGGRGRLGVALRDSAVPRVPLDACGCGRRRVEALALELGDRHTFTVTNPKGAARPYKRVSSAAHEESLSRIYCGIHFRTAMNVGFKMGRLTARNVDRTLLRPLDG